MTPRVEKEKKKSCKVRVEAIEANEELSRRLWQVDEKAKCSQKG